MSTSKIAELKERFAPKEREQATIQDIIDDINKRDEESKQREIERVYQEKVFSNLIVIK